MCSGLGGGEEKVEGTPTIPFTRRHFKRCKIYSTYLKGKKKPIFELNIFFNYKSRKAKQHVEVFSTWRAAPALSAPAPCSEGCPPGWLCGSEAQFLCWFRSGCRFAGDSSGNHAAGAVSWSEAWERSATCTGHTHRRKLGKKVTTRG